MMDKRYRTVWKCSDNQGINKLSIEISIVVALP